MKRRRRREVNLMIGFVPDRIRFPGGKPPGNLRTLADMSEQEIQDLELSYGCPVKRPEKRT